MQTHPENTCSNCKSKLDAADSVTGPEVLPSEGDISVCAYCGQLGVYDAEMKIRKMEEAEMHLLFKEQPDVAKQVLGIQSIFAYLSEKRAQQKDN